MPEVWDRRDPRVDYQGAIRLLVGEQGHLIDGLTHNISESGVQVTAWRSPGLGSAVTCELALPRQRLALRGRVVWQRPLDPTTAGPGAMGMGIEFVGLSTFDVTVLRRVVGERRDRCRPLRLWLEGLSQPLRAEGKFTEEGVELRTELPFVRHGADIEICFSADDPTPERGRLRGVALDLDEQIPQLVLTVALEEHEPLVGPFDDPLLEPGEVIYELTPDQVIYELTPDQVISSAPDDPTVVTSAAGVIETNELTDEPAVAREDKIQISGIYDTPEPRPPSDAPHWTMGEALTRPARRPDHSWRTAQAQQGQGWLWVGAVTALLALGLALVLRGDAPTTRRAAVAATPAAATLAAGTPTAATPAAATPAAASARAVGPRSRRTPTRRTPTRPTTGTDHPVTAVPPAPVVRAAASSVDPALPRVTITDQRATLLLPIGGSVAEAKHYWLARPDGVAINLPRGHALLPFGVHAVDLHGFRSVWVRRRLDGSQVRVFFALEGSSPEVTLKGEAILISIARPREREI